MGAQSDRVYKCFASHSLTTAPSSGSVPETLETIDLAKRRERASRRFAGTAIKGTARPPPREQEYRIRILLKTTRRT